MKYYYKDDHVTLYHGDCLAENLQWLDSDVLVTDPPYGMSYSGFGGRQGEPARTRGRHEIAGDATTSARDDVLAKWGDRPALVFGKWTEPRPANARARLIWDKRPCGFIGDIRMPWGSTEEEIYVLGHGFVGRRSSNIVSTPTLMSAAANRPDHPTPKPTSLMELLIQKCPPGVIADPFAGSGATLIAARSLGRRAIGVELEEKYCEIAARRLSQGVLDFASLTQEPAS